MVESAEEIPESAKNISVPKYKRGLYLKLKSLSGDEFLKVQGILAEYHGTVPVIVYCTDTGKKLEAPERLKIAPSERLLDELCAVIGKENVKFITKPIENRSKID